MQYTVLYKIKKSKKYRSKITATSEENCRYLVLGKIQQKFGCDFGDIEIEKIIEERDINLKDMFGDTPFKDIFGL